MIILHVAFAFSIGVQQSVVFSPNTDVFELLKHHFLQPNIRRFYFKTGRKGMNIETLQDIF
jgi:hypothetical protein